MDAIIHHISSNAAGIIQDTVFAFIGVFLGILFTPKSNDPFNGNGTSIHQTMQFIQQNIIYNEHRTYRQYNRRRSSSNSDDNPLPLYLVGSMVLAFVFYKFHDVIMAYFTGFILLALASTITIAIKLYMNNQYDNLNRFWTGVASFFIAIDVATLILMTKQIDAPLTATSMTEFISTFGMNGVLKYAYFALGFIFVLLPNLFLIVLLIHMFAVNHHLVRGGRISAYIIRKTSPFTISPTSIAVIGVFICTISILFTSGVMYGFFSHSIEQNPASYATSVKQNN